jgi:hypothetical protein
LGKIAQESDKAKAGIDKASADKKKNELKKA